ncbi:hypothetical protein HS99_0033295 [Kitasatospora aureofaciens]|uniref:Uncharacterized protein n=1 Tax=Kitasatospora aureofaciens TaxID=1894 RepID=A0A1E7N3E1_KITAU|nr:hypothetical protein B6264_10325 [Kitasatospora aureofaciens]OEV35200.1 hypothetical protein HS99_0033295 [Kitasatospora aureofaciens]QEV00459.1 hypothetical protein CP971_15295 [Streptomyces viridifaciens]GGU67683.1 hypothetical protein GCM10010502_18690 [Kitasatospora aureofaciens]
MAACTQCSASAVIEDLDVQPPQTWSLGCATARVRAGDPMINYRSLNRDSDYAHILAGGSTQVLPFG